jgi:spore coat polysaccharide biosynthesis protein SpsF
MQPKTAAIIQARYASSRLPGKVLLGIAGEPMLVRVVERARRARTLHEVLVATSEDPADDAIAELCAGRGYPCYRGSLHDVLDRFYGAASTAGAAVIVRLTADCPLIDPEVIDQVVTAFLGEKVNGELYTDHSSRFAGPWDFAANRLPPPWHRTWPIGLDVEVCAFQALERAWREGDQPHHREHVMPYLYEQEGRFRVLLVDHDPDYGSLRWTVDTPEDLEVVRRIYAYFGGRGDFSWKEILALYEAEPDLVNINAQVKPKIYSETDKRRDRET